jgi:hypothetical protein
MKTFMKDFMEQMTDMQDMNMQRRFDGDFNSTKSFSEKPP